MPSILSSERVLHLFLIELQQQIGNCLYKVNEMVLWKEMAPPDTRIPQISVAFKIWNLYWNICVNTVWCFLNVLSSASCSFTVSKNHILSESDEKCETPNHISVIYLHRYGCTFLRNLTFLTLHWWLPLWHSFAASSAVNSSWYNQTWNWGDWTFSVWVQSISLGSWWVSLPLGWK